jgi:tripartite-type tricarboxylate transporter receptor subunit TctC
VGLVAPAGTPAEVVQRLNTQAVKALYSAEVMALYRDMMMETVTSTPDAFGAFMRLELAVTSRWCASAAPPWVERAAVRAAHLPGRAAGPAVF